MAAEELWYFAKDHLMNTPSRKCGIDPDKELSYRQQAANFIQDMGQRLNVNQLCINTAIVYMHRFYMFHPFTKFHRNSIATCALFLAAKVEEQPRKLEHVIRVAHLCLHRDDKPLDAKSEAYLERAQELVGNENIMLPTLGFDVAIDHPHTHVVKCCQLVRASKDLAQTSYFMATNSLHLTTMCLQYKPTVVACVCIHLACKWANWEIPRSSEGRDWFWYVDKNVTSELLEELTAEFLAILDKCPSRLKRKIKSATAANKSDKDGTSSKKPGDPSSNEEYTMADMNQYHDLRIDKADWKEVTRSSKNSEKAKSSEERKAAKGEQTLVPPSPQVPLKTPSPQKMVDPLQPVVAMDQPDTSRPAGMCTPPAPKKQKPNTPKQPKEKRDAERRERDRGNTLAKQNLKERATRAGNAHAAAMIAAVASGEVPKPVARAPASTQAAAASMNNNHKQHETSSVERRRTAPLPGTVNEWKEPTVKVESSHTNGRHVTVPQQPQQTQAASASGQFIRDSDSVGCNVQPDVPASTRHREHRGHGSRSSAGAHHHVTMGQSSKVQANPAHAGDTKDFKEKVTKHHRSKTPPAAVLDLGHPNSQPPDNHQFVPGVVKQEPRVAPQSPNEVTVPVEEPVTGFIPLQPQRHNQPHFQGADLAGVADVRALEKQEKKEKHKHKNRSRERSKTKDREHITQPTLDQAGNISSHQKIKLTIPRDKMGSDDETAAEPDVTVNQMILQPRTALLPCPPSLASSSYHSQPGLLPEPVTPKVSVGALKIKIPKEKLQTPRSPRSSVMGSGGLKIKISKARISAAASFPVYNAVEEPVAQQQPVDNVKDSRKRTAANKEVSGVKPKVPRQNTRSSRRPPQMQAPALMDLNLNPNQMPSLTPFQASLMAPPDTALGGFPVQGGQGPPRYNHAGMMQPEQAMDQTPKMVATRRGAQSKRSVTDNSAMHNAFHSMNPGPYQFQQFLHPPPQYQNNYYHQVHANHPPPQFQPDYRFFMQNRPPMPPPLPMGPPPEAPPPPPPE